MSAAGVIESIGESASILEAHDRLTQGDLPPGNRLLLWCVATHGIATDHIADCAEELASYEAGVYPLLRLVLLERLAQSCACHEAASLKVEEAQGAVRLHLRAFWEAFLPLVAEAVRRGGIPSEPPGPIHWE